LRVKAELPWPYALGIPAVQILLFCYIVYAPHGQDNSPAVKSTAPPVSKQVNISLQGVNDGVDRTEQVKKAFTDLAQTCPAVTSAAEVVVRYEEGIGTLWRGEKLGWGSDLYFEASDARGEHHHFYLRQDGPRELMVFAKQVSLDWCGIKAKMQDYHLIKL